MVRKIVFFATLLLTLQGRAQEVASGERNGLLQTTASIYPMRTWNGSSWSNLVGGYLSYQFEDRYAFRGDIYTLVGQQSGTAVYSDFTVVQAGFFRNFSKKRFDFFAGLQIGLAGVQISRFDSVSQQNMSTKRYYQPVLDIPVGIKFHVSNYFYFFAEMHNFFLRHPEDDMTLANTSFSGGLGLQLPLKKLLRR